MTKGQSHSIKKKLTSLNRRHSLTKVTVMCTIAGEGEATSPATGPHPDSMEPVKKDQNNSIKMADH